MAVQHILNGVERPVVKPNLIPANNYTLDPGPHQVRCYVSNRSVAPRCCLGHAHHPNTFTSFTNEKFHGLGCSLPHQLFNRTTINRVARTMDPYTDDWALELGGDRAGRLAAPVPPPAPMGAVGLTDEVALNMYEYWREGGMASVLASKLYGALATCLTTLWTVALFVGVDWQALVSPAAVLRLRVSDMVEHPTAADVLFMVYFACGMAASAYLMVDAATAVKRLRRTRGYLRANMGVATDADLARRPGVRAAAGADAHRVAGDDSCAAPARRVPPQRRCSDHAGPGHGHPFAHHRRARGLARVDPGVQPDNQRGVPSVCAPAAVGEPRGPGPGVRAPGAPHV